MTAEAVAAPSAQDTGVAQGAGTAAGRVSTVDTSAEALQALGLRGRQKQLRAVYDVVLACQRGGVQDMSLTEIRNEFERRHSTRIDLNRVSARVYDLCNMGWLQRREDTRPCSVTGRNVHAVFVPAKQARLCA